MNLSPYERHIAQNRISVGNSYLTTREYQVVCKYIQGKTHQEALSEIGIAPQTLGRHLRTAKDRLGVRTVYELVAKVVASDTLRRMNGSAAETVPGIDSLLGSRDKRAA